MGIHLRAIVAAIYNIAPWKPHHKWFEGEKDLKAPEVTKRVSGKAAVKIFASVLGINSG